MTNAPADDGPVRLPRNPAMPFWTDDKIHFIYPQRGTYHAQDSRVCCPRGASKEFA